MHIYVRMPTLVAIGFKATFYDWKGLKNNSSYNVHFQVFKTIFFKQVIHSKKSGF